MSLKAPPSGAATGWTSRIALHEIPDSGRKVELTPDAALRAELAKAAGVTAMPRLHAEFDLRRHGRDRLRVIGRVNATVEQVCVVTLEPVENEVEEAFDLLFTEEPLRPASTHYSAEEAPVDDPEPMVGGAVDLGALATEYLLLGIDPYPRKPDAVFEGPHEGAAGDHPFAALAALKKGPG